jgi:hypothetical protein
MGVAMPMGNKLNHSVLIKAHIVIIDIASLFAFSLHFVFIYFHGMPSKQSLRINTFGTIGVEVTVIAYFSWDRNPLWLAFIVRSRPASF